MAAGIEGLESELIRLPDQAVCSWVISGATWNEADAERGRSRHRNRAMFADGLRGGDVVEVPRGRRAGRYMVLFRRSSGRGDEGRPSCCWARRGHIVDLGRPRRGDEPTRKCHSPHPRSAQGEGAECTKGVQLLRSFRPDWDHPPLSSPPRSPASNPVTTCPDLADHLRAAAAGPPSDSVSPGPDRVGSDR